MSQRRPEARSHAEKPLKSLENLQKSVEKLGHKADMSQILLQIDEASGPLGLPPKLQEEGALHASVPRHQGLHRGFEMQLVNTLLEGALSS